MYDFPPFGGPKDDPQSDLKGGSASQSIKQISEDLKAFFGEGEKKKSRFTSIESSIYPHYKNIERRPGFYRSGYTNRRRKKKDEYSSGDGPNGGNGGGTNFFPDNNGDGRGPGGGTFSRFFFLKKIVRRVFCSFSDIGKNYLGSEK